MTLATVADARPSARADWLIPTTPIALAFIPIAAGTFRLTTLAYRAAVTPDNVRFFASPISAMVVSIVIAFYAIRRRMVSRHQAWMRRAYAIGQGAGTQALTQIPLVLAFGRLAPDALALAMGAAWVLNLAVAEWLIRRGSRRPVPRSHQPNRPSTTAWPH